MTSTDFLNIAIGGGFLLLVIFLCISLYSLINLINSARIFIQEIQLMRDGIKLGVLSLVKNILNGRR